MADATIVDTKVVTQTTPDAEVKTLTQGEADKIVIDRLVRERSKWAKDLGMGDDFSKEDFSKYKQHLDDQKTDAQKNKEDAETYKTKFNDISSQLKQNKIEAGVDTILAELEVDKKHSKTILKLANLEGVYEDDLDTEKLKLAITKTLEEELPMLLTKERVKFGMEKQDEKKPVKQYEEVLKQKYKNNPYYKG